jgi:hypothetical protein
MVARVDPDKYVDSMYKGGWMGDLDPRLDLGCPSPRTGDREIEI